jgi:hypothetical protein
VTTLDTLHQLKSELHNVDVELILARDADPVRDLFRKGGLLTVLGDNRIFHDVDSAVSFCCARRTLTLALQAGLYRLRIRPAKSGFRNVTWPGSSLRS